MEKERYDTAIRSRLVDDAKNASQAAQCGSEKPARDLRWDECGLEQKVERLRRELRSLQFTTQYNGQRTGEAHELAHDHSHDAHGRVMKPAHSNVNRLLAGEARGSDPLA